MTQQAMLFDGYYWGMPRKEVISQCHAKACEDAPDNPLLLCNSEPVTYLQSQWREIFTFNRDDELTQVMLAQANPQHYLETQHALSNAGLKPVFIETEGDALDVLAHGRAVSYDQAQQLALEFESNAMQNSHWLTIYFFPENYLQKILEHKKIKSYEQALDRAPENFTLVSLNADVDNLKIIYTAPLLNRKNVLKYGEMIRKG